MFTIPRLPLLSLMLLACIAIPHLPQAMASDAQASRQELDASKNGVELDAPSSSQDVKRLRTNRTPDYTPVKDVQLDGARESTYSETYSVKDQARREYVDSADKRMPAYGDSQEKVKDLTIRRRERLNNGTAVEGDNPTPSTSGWWERWQSRNGQSAE